MKNKRKRIVTGISIVIIGFIAYIFLFGKLFPYSPIIIGFQKHETNHTIIYIQKGADFTDFSSIDTLIPTVEGFHELEFLYKPKIFVFKDSISYSRRSPSKARFCVFYNSRLFISPWALQEAKNQKIDLAIYLTHELSHSLLHQHSGIINAPKYPKWLLEGIAVYSSNQMGTSFYPSKEGTYRLIKNGNYIPPQYFKTSNEDKVSLDVPNRIPFMYSEFACIVDFLIEKYGKKKFLNYMKALIEKPNHAEVFYQIYQIEFDAVISDFKQYASTYKANI
ncbi:MAG TPA: hypothetical protein P5509_08480 [Bacteroidales bacterium]|nr:hypothetical protein [Bacteroidales bacterium]